MKSSKGKGLLGLLAILLCVGLFGYFGYDTMDDIKLGLDLAGGVSITYQTLKEDPTAEEMSDTIYKLQQRVEKYSTEAEVYQEGGNRINIDIPGEKDADAVLRQCDPHGRPGGKRQTRHHREERSPGEHGESDIHAGGSRSFCQSHGGESGQDHLYHL